MIGAASLSPEREGVQDLPIQFPAELSLKFRSAWPILQLGGNSFLEMVMKINEQNISSLGIDGAGKSQEATKTGQAARPAGATAAPASSDDVHLSELVRSLRSLASDSPERQARIEQIARAYANGAYHVDSQATASKMIDDAFET